MKKDSRVRKKTAAPRKTVTISRDEARKWARSKEGREAARRMAAIRDEDIDTSDIPEVTDMSRFVRVLDHPEHPLYRAVTQSVTIRLNVPDIEAARRLSKKKGLPYQTYIKRLLHEALVRELNA
jgi:predicted DNA binding CopG/RHH family protein